MPDGSGLGGLYDEVATTRMALGGMTWFAASPYCSSVVSSTVPSAPGLPASAMNSRCTDGSSVGSPEGAKAMSCTSIRSTSSAAYAMSTLPSSSSANSSWAVTSRVNSSGR